MQHLLGGATACPTRVEAAAIARGSVEVDLNERAEGDVLYSSLTIQCESKHDH